MDKVALHKAICESLTKLYEVKNKRYNNSFAESFKEYGQTMSCIRLDDKMRRFKALTKDVSLDDQDESVEDTLKDLANYAIMTLIEMKTNSNTDNANIQQGIFDISSDIWANKTIKDLSIKLERLEIFESIEKTEYIPLCLYSGDYKNIPIGLLNVKIELVRLNRYGTYYVYLSEVDINLDNGKVGELTQRFYWKYTRCKDVDTEEVLFEGLARDIPKNVCNMTYTTYDDSEELVVINVTNNCQIDAGKYEVSPKEEEKDE